MGVENGIDISKIAIIHHARLKIICFNINHNTTIDIYVFISIILTIATEITMAVCVVIKKQVEYIDATLGKHNGTLNNITYFNGNDKRCDFIEMSYIRRNSNLSMFNIGSNNSTLHFYSPHSNSNRSNRSNSNHNIPVVRSKSKHDNAYDKRRDSNSKSNSSINRNKICQINSRRSLHDRSLNWNWNYFNSNSNVKSKSKKDKSHRAIIRCKTPHSASTKNGKRIKYILSTKCRRKKKFFIITTIIIIITRRRIVRIIE